MYFPISLLNFNCCFLPFFQAIKLLPIAVTMFGNYGNQRNVAKDASTYHIYNIKYLQYLLCQDPSTGLLLWLALHCVAGYMLVIQKTTTHHGPELYHAGDTPRQVEK